MPKEHFICSINFVAARLNGCCFFHANTLFAVSSGENGRQAIFSLSQNGTEPSITSEYASPRCTIKALLVVRLLVNST